jgi:hypothetical protein
MTIHLTPRGEELLEAALSRGLGRSPEEVVEHALEAANNMGLLSPGDESERKRQAVASMMAFSDEFHCRLAPGETVQDFIREGRKY